MFDNPLQPRSGPGAPSSLPPAYPQSEAAPPPPSLPHMWGGATSPGQFWVGSPSPDSVPPAPPKKMRLARRWLMMLILSIMLLGGGLGLTLYALASRPNPILTNVTSQYRVGGTIAGASATTFQVEGLDFSGHVLVTFLLDNMPVPGTEAAQSDGSGKINAMLTVTDVWPIGRHLLKARDADGYETQKGWPLTIVRPGQAGTPGPDGAPPDNADLTITGTIQASNVQTVSLTVKGSEQGGTVCGPNDDGHPHSTSGSSDGYPYTETLVLTCSGTYQGGVLTYRETVISDTYAFTNGITCTAATPYVDERLDGTFTSSTEISGTFSADAVTLTCSLASKSDSGTIAAQAGTWNGQAAIS
jgi:hypothetical protein